MNFFSELNGAVCVTEDLNGLDPREIIKEPGTACEHGKPVTLNL